MVRKLAVLMLLAVVAFAAFPAAQTAAQADILTLNGTVHVTKADILATNGVVHVIDGVLVPPAASATMMATMAATSSSMMAAATMAATPSSMMAAGTMAATMAAPTQTIADIVAGNPDFSTLLAALKAAGLADMFAKPGTFTVFAPTNEAFTAALKTLNLTADQLLADKATLTKILTYHVVGKVLMSDDLEKLTSVTTVEGQDITLAYVMTGAAMSSTTLSVSKDAKLGAYLVGPNGHTLYTFKNDKAGSNASACTGGCAKAWPALTVPAGTTPTASSDVTGKIGTFAQPDGSLAVTYNGWPLYYFSKDAKAGDTTGQGIGNVWYVAAP